MPLLQLQHRPVWLALALSAWAVSTSAQGPPTPPSAEEAVRAEVEAYYADFSARDWPAFASHFWPGAIIATAWQPPGDTAVRVVVQTVPEFVAAAPEGPGSREIFEESMIDAEIRVVADLAQVWARYEARFGDPGDVVEWAGTDAFSLIRLGDRWKITSLSFAGDEQGAGEAEEMEDPAGGDGPAGAVIRSLAPILYVDEIEPLLPFWVDGLGFQRVGEELEDDRLGFVILEKDGVSIMFQTRRSIAADIPAIADTPLGGTILYVRVDDLDEVVPALDGLEVLVPRRTTFYGAEEIFVREPGGHVVGFAAFPGEV